MRHSLTRLAVHNLHIIYQIIFVSDVTCDAITEFRCASGKCLVHWRGGILLLCNGESDCPDSSDEVNCSVSCKEVFSNIIIIVKFIQLELLEKWSFVVINVFVNFTGDCVPIEIKYVLCPISKLSTLEK